ncbi:MAG: hypothetical protein AAF901_02950 [Bacteroidota bacterium]
MSKTRSNSGRSKGGGYSSSGSGKGSSSTRRSPSPSKSGGSSYNNDRYSSGGNGSSRSHQGGSSKGGGGFDNDYHDDNYNRGRGNSGSSKGSGSQFDDYNDDYSNDNYNANNNYGSEGDSDGYDNYDDNDNYSDTGRSGGSSRYNDEPINDPPYDDYGDEDHYNDDGYDNQRGRNDSGSHAKSPRSGNTSKGGGGQGGHHEEADMTFTEEEAYPDSGNERSEGRSSGNSINRVWVWAGGAVPAESTRNPRSSWWRRRASLGMTDYVISLNDHGFPNGLSVKPNYIDRRNRSNRWAPICEVLRIARSYDISPHLMVFLTPNPAMIREAAQVLTEILEHSEVAPRSIQLDLERWWTHRSQAERRRGEQAIQRYFKDEWRGRNLELGIGVTCIGSTPGAVHGAVQLLDFVVPQIYASPRNYGRPLRERSIQRHYNRAADVINQRGKVIVGQTAYSRYVTPEIMKEMLEILLRSDHPAVGGVREVAYWSDIHLMNSRNNREFFQRMTEMVKRGGLNSSNINSL